MAKLLACLLVSALAVDQQPPTVSLNLDNSVLRKDVGVKMTKHSDVSGGHAMVCEVGTKPANCKLPTARAYDHHDGVLQVAKAYYLVMTTEKGAPAPQWTKKVGIDFKLRSEWIVEHTACDKSGESGVVLLDQNLKTPVIVIV